MEHKPWVGSAYQTGIEGQKVALVGYSHWTEDAEAADFTIDVIKQVIDGKQNLRFFNALLRYMKSARPGLITDHATLWSKVLFFNFIPTIIGDSSGKFRSGSREQTRLGAERASRLLGLYLPDKVLVFTRRGFNEFPPMDKFTCGEELNRLLRDDEHIWWGTYTYGVHTASVCGLRHSQGAKAEVMEGAVKAFLDMPVQEPTTLPAAT